MRLGHHPRVEIDAAAVDARLPQRGEQAAGTATDVDDGRVGREQLGVPLCQRHRDVGRVAPKAPFEPDVVEVDGFGRLGRADGDCLRRRGRRPRSLRPSQLPNRAVEPLDLVAQLGEAMRCRTDACVRGDRATEVVERALERHQLGLQQLELHTLHTDLMKRVVRGGKELDVRVEDAERVDRRHQLRHLLLQRGDEGPELLHLPGRPRLDAHRNTLAHPHRDPLERSPRDRADHRRDRAPRPNRKWWRVRGGRR